jgi:membrane protein YdbS with pleckstrin-like domain
MIPTSLWCWQPQCYYPFSLQCSLGETGEKHKGIRTQKENLNTKAHELWTGKPWILPNLVTRSISAAVAAVVISLLEFYFNINNTPIADRQILGVPVILWTVLAIFILWVVSLTRLLVLRASNTYILRNDGLEVRTGILSSKSFVVAPAGFSDLEVTRSVSGRIVNSGNIIVRTQGDSDITMVKVRKPLKVADQIREVMARPTVRIEGQEPITEKK